MRPALSASLLLLALAASGCSSESAVEVEVDDDFFEPDELTIDSGTEVHFEVEPGAQHPHTVTIHKAGEPLDATVLDVDVAAGEDVHFTFATAGTYHVWCTNHGTMTTGMHLRVTVE